jgi:hypothetical protein
MLTAIAGCWRDKKDTVSMRSCLPYVIATDRDKRNAPPKLVGRSFYQCDHRLGLAAKTSFPSVLHNLAVGKGSVGHGKCFDQSRYSESISDQGVEHLFLDSERSQVGRNIKATDHGADFHGYLARGFFWTTGRQTHQPGDFSEFRLARVT